MKTGEMAITESGVVPEHAHEILKVARAKGEHILLRPVNHLSTRLIKDGYGTKDMHVKGKSSDWGPQAGFICVDQALSKLGGKKPDEVMKFNAKVQDSILKRDAKPVALVISRARVEELAAQGVHQILSQEPGAMVVEASPGGGAGPRRRFTLVQYDSLGPGQKTFYRKYLDDIGAIRSRIAGLNDCFLVLADQVGGERLGQVVEVLAHPRTGIPLTADYDLYAVCPELNATTFGQMQARNARPAMPTFGTAEERAATALQRAFRSRQAQKRIGDVGMAPNYLLAAVRDINAACNRADNPVCHHGGEVDNPFPENDWEIMVFNGNPGARNGFLRTENQAELERVAAEIISEGKIFYTNRAYKDWNRPPMSQLPDRLLS